MNTQTLEELKDLKCLYREGIEKQLAQGFIQVNPFKDVDCLRCQNYYSAIVCYHYINRRHMEHFQRLME